MDIYKCGTPVTIKLANVKGFISACCIRHKNAQYEIIYYEGLQQHIIWANESEFEINEPETIKIGFKET